MSATVTESSLANHPVVTRDRWIAERRKLLAREKELTRLRDEVARERRALPWVRIAGTMRTRSSMPTRPTGAVSR